MKFKNAILSLIIILSHCSPTARLPLDSSTPAGAIYQLLPFLFPGLRPPSSKAMKTYYIPQTGSSASIKGKDITLTVPYSSSLDSLIAEFYHTGILSTVNSVEQVSGSTLNSYNANFTDQISASDRSTLDYTVQTVKGSPTSNDLLAFSLSTNTQINSYEAIITGNLVIVYVPYGTDLSSLIATFSHNGKSVNVGGIEQTSGKSAQNFLSAVNYSVFAESGAKQDYTVSVSIGAATSKDILSFWLNSSPGTIIGTDILVTLPIGKDITSLVANFIHTGVDISVNSKSIYSGESTLNYTSPVKYTVYAKDGSKKDYKVTVSSVDSVSFASIISGLGIGKTLILQYNGANNTTINSNGNFSFSKSLALGNTYTISVLTYPTNQYCSVTNGTGTASINITNIIVYCSNTPGNSTPSFTDIGNQTIKDNNTGLIWMKCTVGTVSGVPVGGSDCSVGSWGSYDFCSASTNDCNGGVNNTSLTAPPWLNGNTSSLWNACNDANASAGFAGRTDWRVPSLGELQSIVDNTRVSPSINITYFPGTAGQNYLASTSVASDPSKFWTVIFSNGGINENFKSGINRRVRCVSGP